MKTLLSLLLFVGLFALVASAQVPTYAPNTLLSSYIVSGGATSNSVAAVIDCRKQQNISIQWVATGIVTNAASFSVSVDGVTYNTNHFTLAWTNATAPFVLCTNLQVQGYGYVRLDRVADTGNRGSTNTVTWGVKISSP